MLIVQTTGERELTAALLGQLDGVEVGRWLRASQRSRTRTSRSSLPNDGAARLLRPACAPLQERLARRRSIVVGATGPSSMRRSPTSCTGRRDTRHAALRIARRGCGPALVDDSRSSAGGAIQRQRCCGTLELLIASAGVASILVLSADHGGDRVDRASTAWPRHLLWGRLLFGVPLRSSIRLLFASRSPARSSRSACSGFVLASTLVLYRVSELALGSALEYPIWTITGLLIPLSLLPGLGGPIAWAWRRPGACAQSAARPSAAVGAPLLVCAALSSSTRRSRSLLLAPLRTPRARPGDPLADMRPGCGSSSSAARSASVRSSRGSARRSTSRRCCSARRRRSSSSPTSAGPRISSRTPGSWSATPCSRRRCAALFGMGFAIEGERWSQTLSPVLATPANRAALFLGRALPVLVNAAVTASTGFVGGALLLGFRMPLVGGAPAGAARAARVLRVDRPRDAHGRGRAADARRADHREPDDGRAADLLRGERAARQAARLDAHDRARACRSPTRSPPRDSSRGARRSTSVGTPVLVELALGTALPTRRVRAPSLVRVRGRRTRNTGPRMTALRIVCHEAS